MRSKRSQKKPVDPYTVELQEWNYETKEYDSKGPVSMYLLAKCIQPEQLATLLENCVNNFSSGFTHGRNMGREMRTMHRTLQRSMVAELCGIVAGLSEQEHTDVRNEGAIKLAKAVAQLAEESGFGPLV